MRRKRTAWLTPFNTVNPANIVWGIDLRPLQGSLMKRISRRLSGNVLVSEVPGVHDNQPLKNRGARPRASSPLADSTLLSVPLYLQFDPTGCNAIIGIQGLENQGHTSAVPTSNLNFPARSFQG